MSNEEYIHRKIQKAAQRLDEADVLLENKFSDSVISRLYYAVFLCRKWLFDDKRHSRQNTHRR